MISPIDFNARRETAHSTALARLTAQMMPALESELRRQIGRITGSRTSALSDMLTYHMGWTGEGSHPEAGGKRIRPLLLLLAAADLRDDWATAIPGAAAVEIVHNFSLVHDDIQDNSFTRRGRPALWAKVGAPMAINAGDSLFTIAHLAILDLQESLGAHLVLKAAGILQQACLDLTRGQFMDLAYQRRAGLTVEDYWPMIEAKTAALLAAAAQIGALVGSEDEVIADRFRAFGRLVGLAFQVQDDILGIWGDEALLGKSTASDLLEGKSSLPVLYGLSHEARFAQRWLAGPLQPEEVQPMAQLLQEAGAHDYAVRECRRLTQEALDALQAAGLRGEAGEALDELTHQLLGRST